MLTRRNFVGTLLKASALALMPERTLLAETPRSFPLRLAHAAPVEVPANFIGLGYEMSSVAEPDLLSPANHRYVELVKGLGPQGVLRVGGIVANYTRYIADGASRSDRKDTVITRASLERFAAFLDRIGWTAIWSVNFAQGTIDKAVREARAVFDVLGPRLLALEIGNEVDNYGKSEPFRNSSYDFAAYRKEYGEWHAAIAKAVPGVHFAAPDTAAAGNWLQWVAKYDRNNVQLLTTHYYRNGQKRGNAEQLLTPDPRLKDVLVSLRAVSQQSGLPWRMCETNSFSGGGLPGVSDTFVGTLWTLNFMLLLAQYGCSGVNIETGVNQLGFISSYSPIRADGEGVVAAGAPYYGMLAFATAFAECHQILPLDGGTPSRSVTAYVLGVQGKPRSVVVINMDTADDAHVSAAKLGMRHASVLRLLAPAPNSSDGITFGGASVDTAGQWRAVTQEKLHGVNLVVPRMSAAVLCSTEL